MSGPPPEDRDTSGPPGDGGMGRPRDTDLPRRLLSLAAAWTPAGRGEWSRAMLAELDQVTGRRDRWRFALGAARAALVPPRSSRLAGIVLSAIAAAAALAIHVLAPETGAVTAIAVPGLPALCAWLALATQARPRQPSPAGRAAQVIGVAGIIACPVLAMRETALYPGQGGDTLPLVGSIMTVMFAAEVAVYVLLVLRRPGLLGAGRHSGLLGLAAALAAGWVFVLNQPPGGQSDNPVITPAVMAEVAGALLAAGALGALLGLMRRRGLDHSVLRGVGEVLWGVLLCGPAVFIANLLTTSHSAIAAEATEPVFITEAHQQGATSVLAWIAQDDLGGAVMIFTGASIIIAVIFAVFHGVFYFPGQPPGRLPAGTDRPEAS